MDYKEFILKSRALLEAPAGYGKTYSIIECLKLCEGKQLILTHTHAGIASLKKKINECEINSSKFNIETIDSFSLRLYKSYMGREKQKTLEDDYTWKDIRIDVSSLLKKSQIVKSVLKNTYTNVFVDEYQDCTRSANLLVEELSNIIPTKIFGDWMQAIFNFDKDDPLTQYNEINQDFLNNKFELDIPWRWKKGNEKLGEDIKSIREVLKSSKIVNLDDYKNIEVISNENELNIICYDLLKLKNKDKSILLIHPNKNTCRTISQFFKYGYSVLEAIDDKDFYKISKSFDGLKDSSNIRDDFFLILKDIFLKGDIGEYFKNGKFVKKIKEKDKKLSEEISRKLLEVIGKFSFSAISYLMIYIYEDCGFKLKDNRSELFKSICDALVIAENKEITVHEAMKMVRNKLRRFGKIISKRAIDTTLLTKGLEFDVVVVMNGDNIGNSYGQYDIKKWYVAVSRAQNRLIIYSKTKEINFFKI